MNQGHKETISVRVVSCVFIVLALAIFKPFGLEVWEWQAWVHLLAIFALGMISCFLTEGVLKYIVSMPRSDERGVSYIIRRNLWFQCINTPLVALLICLYRHFMMSNYRGLQIPSNVLSWTNYFETLIIIAFLSFAIGLYWRFKYRSRYLAAELEETRLLNEQLQKMQGRQEKGDRSQEKGDRSQESGDRRQESGERRQETGDRSLPSPTITLAGTTNETVTLDIAHLLYIEAVGNYIKIYHLRDGQVRNDMLRATMKQIEDDLQVYPMIVRCHRAFLVNLGQVEQIVSHSGTMQLLIKHSHESIPVSRSNMAQIRSAIVQNQC